MTTFAQKDFYWLSWMCEEICLDNGVWCSEMFHVPTKESGEPWTAEELATLEQAAAALSGSDRYALATGEETEMLQIAGRSPELVLLSQFLNDYFEGAMLP